MPPRKTTTQRSTSKRTPAKTSKTSTKKTSAKTASSPKAENTKPAAQSTGARLTSRRKGSPAISGAKKSGPGKPKPTSKTKKSAKSKRLNFAAQKLAGTNVFPAPLLIGCLKTEAGLAQLKAEAVPADLIEVRVDELLQAKVKLKAIEQALRERRQPVLLTARAANEGGAYSWQKGERTKVLFQLMDHADALDLELEHLPQLKRVHEAAITEQLRLILSVHAIQRPASNEQLRTWMHEFQQHEAFCYKIAMRLNQQNDLHQLVDVLLRNPHRRWALMGLGPDAPKSRHVLTGLGSVLVYGYLDKPTAPGQPSTRQLIKALG